MDQSIKSQIERKSLFTYELHYPEDKHVRNESKTTRIPGALPSLNLPISRFHKPQKPKEVHPALSFFPSMVQLNLLNA